MAPSDHQVCNDQIQMLTDANLSWQQHVCEVDAVLVVAAAALAPFAARVHSDGVDAPYPEDKWGPLLSAAADALAAVRSVIILRGVYMKGMGL